MDRKIVGEGGYCFVCGGKGFPDKVCPSCGREALKESFNFEFREDTEDFVTKIDAFGIPGKYRGVAWSAGVLRNSKPDKAEDYNFDKFVNQLDRINSVFADGLISPMSAIIVAPAGYSKMTFAYSCMQRAMDHGFTVAPLLDTVELKRLLVLASENPYYKLYGKVGYDDYIMADTMFVTVTKLRQHEWAYETIQEVLDRRTRKGLSTFIISRFGLSDISRRDSSNQFDALATAVSEDTYKYPAVIVYRDILRREDAC